MEGTSSCPKFVVVEIESKEEAVRLVQVMVNNGFPRLSMLDDLSKHPALKDRTPPSTSSPNFPHPNLSALFNNRPNPNFMQTHNAVVKNEFSGGGSEDYFDAIFEDQSTSLDCMLQNYPATSTSNFEEDFENSMQGGGEGGTSRKRIKVDNNEHHQCQLCGARVKMYGGARWSLQMHVIAVHSKDKVYKCQKCDYQDYRKRMMPRHGLAAHGEELEAVNVVDDEKRAQWDATMTQCFPEIAEKCSFAKFFDK